ncbi:MAG: hypothetical protein K8L97_02125 [Anaerolineae bacterium]|nr:hypothetical protein [Anaerolineae bacterium]
MNSTVYTLQNDHWQAGILPGTGASIAFGRVQKDGQWVDVLRPTPESDYGNSSNCSSFIMLPWCNRIKGGLLRFEGQEYQLRTTKDDGTARHGDVRGRAWTIMHSSPTQIEMILQSADFADMNWPFAFSASAGYMLDGNDFIWTVTLKNEDSRPMPTGFGHHPYFVRHGGVQVQIPCQEYFELADFMATDAPVPLTSDLDFREWRALDNRELNDLMTSRMGAIPAGIHYPVQEIELMMHSSTAFKHILIFAPESKPFFAVEPMTNASDGFNLYAKGIPDSGVFVLQPGEAKTASVRLTIH